MRRGMCRGPGAFSRTRGRAIAALLAGLAAAAPAPPAAASLPPPIIPKDYYGPIRACGQGFAFDALEGEAYGEAGGGDVLRLPGGGLLLESWIYTGIDVSRAVTSLGAVELADGVRLTRIRTDWGDRPPEILYHYDRGSGPFPILSVRSSRFDGSEGDLALLGRIAFGKAAEALCTSVPQALRPTPERNTWDAASYAPRIRRGPLTICLAGLAFDIAADESALLPWAPELRRFRLIGRDRLTTDIDLVRWEPLRAAAAAGEPIAGRAEVEMHEGGLLTDSRGPAPDDDRKRHLRLVHPRVPGLVHPTLDPQAIFAFDPAIPESGVRAILARLRVQRPRDRCADFASA